ncbi:MAG: hypothetical protein ACRDXX_18255 [Stackebrandtia sp.]
MLSFSADAGGVPDLAEFSLHKVLYDVDFDDVIVPGLCGAFYRRPDGDGILSVGMYMMDGVELFRAWGPVGEEHCSHHAAATPDGEFDGPHPGCPDVRVKRRDGEVSALTIRTPRGQRVVELPAADGDRPRRARELVAG